MSVFDAIAVQSDATIFGVFSDVVSVKRGAGTAVTVDAVIEHGVEVLGEYGQVVNHVSMISFRNIQWRPKSGDVVTLPGGEKRGIDEINKDDGYVTRAVLYG